MNVIYFAGNPIVKIQSSYFFSKKELDYFTLQDFKHKNGSVQLTKNTSVINNKITNKFKKYLLKIATKYSTDVLGIEDEIYLTHSWLTKNFKGSSHDKHLHRNCLFSMVYYLHCNSGDLLFNVTKSRINEIFNFEYKIKKYNAFNSTNWTIPVTSNDIVLFPGDLIHSTSPNLNNDDRIVLGLNFFIKGLIGSNDKYAEINLK